MPVLLASEPLRILLVDDNTVNLMVARLQLQKIWPKASITQCTDGAQALRRLEAQVFDVALIDMVMPEMSGLECLAELRSAGINEPVIVLTANGGIDTTTANAPVRRNPARRRALPDQPPSPTPPSAPPHQRAG